jgi:hypothetical protein
VVSNPIGVKYFRKIIQYHKPTPSELNILENYLFYETTPARLNILEDYLFYKTTPSGLNILINIISDGDSS